MMCWACLEEKKVAAAIHNNFPPRDVLGQSTLNSTKSLFFESQCVPMRTFAITLATSTVYSAF